MDDRLLVTLSHGLDSRIQHGVKKLSIRTCANRPTDDHVLLLPLVDGRMVGSDLMGGRAKLLAMQANFQAQVGQRHGLTRQVTQKRASAATRKQAIERAFDVLEAKSGLSTPVLLTLQHPTPATPHHFSWRWAWQC